MRKSLVAGVLVLGLVAVGCDDGDDPTPDPEPAGEGQVLEDATEAERAIEDEVRDEADLSPEDLEEATDE